MTTAIHVVISCPQMFLEICELLGVTEYPPEKAFCFNT